MEEVFLTIKMNDQDKSSYDKMIMNRLKKIEGQVRGIQKMIADSRGCSDILIQMSAIKSALKKTNYLILKRYANTCLAEISTSGNSKLEDFLSTMNEFLSEIDDEFDNKHGGVKDEEND